MIPLLAAAGAVGAINSIAGGAATMLQQVATAVHTIGQKPTGGADFAALMAGHGFKPPQAATPQAASAIHPA